MACPRFLLAMALYGRRGSRDAGAVDAMDLDVSRPQIAAFACNALGILAASHGLVMTTRTRLLRGRRSPGARHIGVGANSGWQPACLVFQTVSGQQPANPFRTPKPG